MFASIRRLNSNITRARRWGLVVAQPACALAADWTARSTSAAEASATRACTSPVLGLNTSLNRPDVPATARPSMKCMTSRIKIPSPASSALSLVEAQDLDPRSRERNA